VCAFATFSSVALWWRHPLALTALLALVSVLFMLAARDRHSWKIFLLSSVFGPITEIICIAAGAWSYALPFAFGIPLYLPLVWGSAGLLIVSFARYFGSFGTMR
jgi:uncharacterized membrane protein YoaT (DUF817 family)